VLLLFSSESKRDENAAVLKSFTPEGEESQPLLIGSNWIVNADLEDLETIQPVLGGIIDTSSP
jgi:hypothetical protein